MESKGEQPTKEEIATKNCHRDRDEIREYPQRPLDVPEPLWSAERRHNLTPWCIRGCDSIGSSPQHLVGVHRANLMCDWLGVPAVRPTHGAKTARRARTKGPVTHRSTRRRAAMVHAHHCSRLACDPRRSAPATSHPATRLPLVRPSLVFTSAGGAIGLRRSSPALGCLTPSDGARSPSSAVSDTRASRQWRCQGRR